MIDLVKKVADELSLKEFQVSGAVRLLFEEDCTIPFVARYRKEMTGSADEVALRAIRDRYSYLQELETAKTKYLKVVEEHCLKNPAFKGRFPELKAKFESCATRQQLEDLYLPFKPKRRSRAQVAKEKGLEPLLDKILAERATLDDPRTAAAQFVANGAAAEADTTTDADQARPAAATIEEALAGASDIFAERVNETVEYRALVRRLSQSSGQLVSKLIEAKEEPLPESEAKPPDPVKSASENAGAGKAKKKKSKKKRQNKVDMGKYETYFDYRESIDKAPSHRIMAVRRGEAEKILRVSIEVDQETISTELKSAVLGDKVATDAVKQFLLGAVEDCYKRLLGPSMETELRLLLKNRAEAEAIQVFSQNLEKLLLLPPIPGRVVLGVDPGLRTGSKLAVVDETGKPLATETIYPDHKKTEAPKSIKAKEVVAHLIETYKVTCVAVGNGTGSREIDRLITQVIRDKGLKEVKRVIVNEAGASVYSTDDTAREEFPDLDATLRSAISIARRLQDPLAELVKINPRSIGVGQYQHDVNPTKLTTSLTEVVESCVNKVGVNLNTASYKLLSYVSGVGPSLAKNIVSHRDNKGPFSSRADVQQVGGLGPKAYEQAAGFLRVPNSEHPLDNSSVHPERYGVVEEVAKSLGTTLVDVVGKEDAVAKIPWERFVTDDIGLPTLHDIAAELVKPGRDPRDEGSRLLFSDDVTDIEDLAPDMKLKGTVTNVTAFGCFVDIGVHQDGLVHISELSHNYVQDAAKVVSVGDVLDVRVLEVDKARRRISLSVKAATEAPPRPSGMAARNGPRGPQRPGDRPRNGPRDASHKGDKHDHRGPHPSRGGSGGQNGGQNNRGRKGKRGPKEKPATLDDLLNKFNNK